MQDSVAITWNRLIASDPGLTRLAFAARATLTALLALGVAAALGLVMSMPMQAKLLCVVVAMLSSVMVNDAGRGAQQFTTLLLPVPAALAITLGSLLSGSQIAGDAVFVAIVFVAVYARRFGARGFAFGMIGFITYFFSLFLHAHFDQLPELLFSVLLGTACAFVVRFWVFMDRPERRARALLRAFYARVSRVLDEVIDVVGGQAPRGRKAIRRQVIRLNETALLVEAALEEIMGAPSASDTLPPALAIFELELALERVANASLNESANGEKNETLIVLHRLRRAAAQRHLGMPEHLDSIEPGHSDQWNAVCRALAEALASAPDIDTVARLAREGKRTNPSSDEAPPAPDTQTPQPAAATRLLPSTRQAIQVAVAAALAIVAGELVSPQRWYWAAITAFVIFAGTNSRGETLAKGWRRVAGTVAGVVVGIGIASVVGGDQSLSAVLIFVCMFLAFYLIQISYGLMMFWITIALALLYGLLGLFSVHLLALRLEETALGAAIGVAVAMLLLPTSTRQSVRTASSDYLDTLEGLVSACAERIAAGPSESDPMHKARVLDHSFQQLRTAARPLTRDIAGAFGRRSARRWVRALLASRHYGRHLAQQARQMPALDEQPALADAFTRMSAQVGRNIKMLDPATHRSDKSVSPPQTSDTLDRRAAALRQAGPEAQSAARLLRRLDRVIVNLIRDFHGDR